MRPQIMQYNTQFDKIYFHNFSAREKATGMRIVVNKGMGVPKINDELEQMYEEKKNSFTGDLNKSILNMLIQFEDKENRKNNPHTNLTDRQKEILILLEKGITSTSKIAKKIGCKDSIISTNLGYMKRKGVDIDKLLRKSRF